MTDTVRNAAIGFGAGRKFFHWSIVLFLTFQIPLGLYMTELPLGTDKLETYSLHKATGMIIFTLAISRLLWSMFSTRPPLPRSTPLYEKIFVKVLQGILYLVVCLMPLSGWMMTSAAGYPLSIFGLFTLPPLIDANKALVDGFIRMHVMQSWILMGAIALHFAGAMRHHVLLKDDTLKNILPGKKQ